MTGRPGQAWRPRHLGILAAGLIIGTLVRAVLLPSPGLAGDLDEFASWVHRIATDGLGRLYSPGDVTFPPVMAFVWGALAALEPAFRTVADASDPAIRVVMKLPPTLADLGLAAAVAYALRARPTWAVVGALAVYLHPAVIDVSALFGQYEPIYVLLVLVAFLLVLSGRNAPAAVALALAVLTKPQAVALVIPFAAWALRTGGPRELVRLSAVGSIVVVLAWLPFLPFGGIEGYLRSVAVHQNDLFAVLSLRAWNPWWILQSSAAGDDFLSDTGALVGPLSPRLIGLIVASLLWAWIFARVHRRPAPAVLAWALVASSLVAFVALTTMHERYAYPALVFLAVLFPDRRAVALALAFGVAFTLNVLAAVPPTPEIGAAVPIGGWLGIVGSLTMTGVAAASLVILANVSREDHRGAAQPAPHPVASAAG